MKTRYHFFLSAFFILLFFKVSLTYSQVLLPTPPMGWNSWNRFGCQINEALIKQTADSMVASGMKDAGYEYIILDDCWQTSRDSIGNIQADPENFPSGIKKLADYIHSKGLKIGIYSDAGSHTCEGRPGSLGFEDIDAKTYASWNIDYLKYDWCFTEGLNAQQAYTKISHELKKTQREIALSVCEWGVNHPWLWASDIAQLWRTTPDILDCWDCKTETKLGWTHILDKQVGLELYAKPGHWNDPDMLVVGNGGMEYHEYVAHFSFWSLLSAPLIAGNDLRNMSPEIKKILLNKEVISINQDSMGLQGHRVFQKNQTEIWIKKINDGFAIILFNRDLKPQQIKLDWDHLKLDRNLKLKLRDLWKHKDLGSYSKSYSARVPGHSIQMLKAFLKTRPSQ